MDHFRSLLEAFQVLDHHAQLQHQQIMGKLYERLTWWQYQTQVVCSKISDPEEAHEVGKQCIIYIQEELSRMKTGYPVIDAFLARCGNSGLPQGVICCGLPYCGACGSILESQEALAKQLGELSLFAPEGGERKISVSQRPSTLDTSLATSRKDDRPSENLPGDSLPFPFTSKEDLNQELDMMQKDREKHFQRRDRF